MFHHPLRLAIVSTIALQWGLAGNASPGVQPGGVSASPDAPINASKPAEDSSAGRCLANAWLTNPAVAEAADEKNWENAAELCRRALLDSPNDPALLAALGRALYQNGDFDDSRAVIERSVEQHHPYGQFAMGVLYDFGYGVTQSATESARWYALAANQGYAPAESNLARDYQTGDGVEQSDELALQWFRSAAEQGHATAERSLGWIYEMGWGIPRDYRQAIYWYERAHDRGDKDATLYLAAMYIAGRGVPRDYAHARQLMVSAAGRRFKDLISYLDAISIAPHRFPLQLAWGENASVALSNISGPYLKILLAEGFPTVEYERSRQVGGSFLCKIGTWRLDHGDTHVSHDEWIAALLQAGAKPNVVCPAYSANDPGNPPSVDAIPYPLVLKRLLDAGADPDAKDSSGDPLLILAIQQHAGSRCACC
jgi:hypothetical protein